VGEEVENIMKKTVQGNALLFIGLTTPATVVPWSEGAAVPAGLQLVFVPHCIK
jgi:hypothetical protein